MTPSVPQEFADFAGAAELDRHFVEAPLERNAPALLALLGVWYTNFWGAQSHAVLPYARRLDFLPDYLQQLEMESNGKRVDRDGRAVDYATCPVVFGNVGANSQHSFHQLLHQGTHLVPIDFVLVKRPDAPQPYQRILPASALAQAAALTQGAVSPGHPERDYPGNAPSTTIVLPGLTPRSRRIDRALRTQGVRAGRDLEHQQLRPDGRGTRQGNSENLPPAFEGNRLRTMPTRRRSH